MSVLFLGTLPPPVTGQSLACKLLLGELRRHREVEVVDMSKSDFVQGVSSVGRVFGVLRMLNRIRRKRNTCDVIYLTVSESLAGNLKDLSIYLLCLRRLSRMVIHLHGGAGMQVILSEHRPLLRGLNRFFLRRIGAVIVLGRRQLDMFAGSVARQRIHIVPNFAPDELYSDDECIVRKFAQVSPLRLLFLSNLLPGKGHIELAEAFRALDADRRAAVRIDFAGGFENDRQKQEFLTSIHGFAQLRYHGTVHGETKRRLFLDSHVFCLPTYYPYEGQPISILEAYAAGCAVITTDHSGIPDIFADGVNGYEVAQRSAMALKEAIQRAIETPERLRAMAVHNFATARERYRASRHTQQLVQILSTVAMSEAQQPEVSG